MDAPDADGADAVAVVVANEVPGTLAVVEAVLLKDELSVEVTDELTTVVVNDELAEAEAGELAERVREVLMITVLVRDTYTVPAAVLDPELDADVEVVVVPDVVPVVVADEVLVTLVDCTSVGCAVGDGVGTRVTARPRHGTVPWGQTKLSTSEYATHVLTPGSG